MPEKQTTKERMKEIIDSIEQGIKDLFQSDKYTQYLRTMSRFHKYSVNNTMIIYMQKPDATLVCGFNRWRDEFERNVLKGEKGIKIIAPTPYKKKIEEAKLDPDTKLPLLDEDGKVITEEKEIKIPMFKPVTVFDVSQTEGKPLPQLATDLSGNVQNYEIFMEALRRSSSVPITIEPMADGTDGFFSLTDQRIAIREGMSEIQTVSAVVHEIAHSKLHNNKNEIPENPEDEPSPKDRNTEEVEAESISFAVCAYYGIATGDNSFGYIAAWSKDKELPELKASLETISKTASELITDIDRNYAEIVKEQGIELAADTSADRQEMVDKIKFIAEWENENAVPEQDRLTYWFGDLGMDVPKSGITDEQIDVKYSEITKDEEQPLNGNITSQEIEDKDENSMRNAVGDFIDEIARKVQEETPIQAPDNGIVPDPSMSIEAMNAFGYTDSDMLPLSKERALELFERDVPIYMLYDDNSEAMAFEVEDIQLYSGYFGVTREDWEQIRDEIPPMDESVISQKREQAFLNNPADSYAIYQLKRNDEAADFAFMRYEWLESKGLKPDVDNYNIVYTGTLTAEGAPIEKLEDLYQTFNINRPADFTGHSLSISDIVALKQDSVVSYHYVDSVGYRELPYFNKKENPLKNAEVLLEDDYGMIDGVINNAPKQPQEQAKPKSIPKQKKEEIKAKKPSVLAKLRKYQEEDRQAQTKHKSAERDL